MYGNSPLTISIIFSMLLTITLVSYPISKSAFGQFNNNENIKTYTDSTHGFKISYPSDWIVQHINLNAPVSIYASQCCADISVFSFPKGNFPSNMTVDTLGRFYHMVAGPDPFYRTISYTGPNHSNERIAGYNAYKSISTTTLGGVPFKSMEIGTIIGNKIYVIAYRAINATYDSYLEPAQKIINSFQVVG